jgi:PHP family Zn ribbon phosphoesterase
MADGRPIVGISSVDLLKMALDIDPNILFIPAHAWTPWFAVFGSKSGFDSLYECFGEYDKYVYAIETGLSSDPIMNWQIKELETRSIVSFSDAHSGPKLGREATVFTGEGSGYSYTDVADAIKQKPEGKLKIGYTIEFFPEEGKYHWTGHRACGVRYSAPETKEKGTTCPVCGKPLTVGVENRVLDLSEKLLTEKDLLTVPNDVGLSFVYDKDKKRKPFVSMIPLLEILVEVNDHSPTKAQREYDRLTSEATEFDILLRKTYDEIEKLGGVRLREAIGIVRARKAHVDPGYDGVFGKVQIFKDNEKVQDQANQQTLF